MNLNEVLKKIERLERQVRVNLNLIDRQDKILDELVARIDVQCREDITHVEIKDEGFPLLRIFKDYKRIILCSVGQRIDLWFSKRDTLDTVIQSINSKKGFKLITDRRYGKLPVKMLPNIKRSNLQTNSCLIVIKL